jgi:DNA-binding MarR family transcriptional regulator
MGGFLMNTTTQTQLYNALSRLSRQMHRVEHHMAHSDVLPRQKVHRGQTHLLLLISQKAGASQKDLAEQMDVRPSSMAELLLKMEQADLITRKQDENDQRIMRIFLTEAGKKAAEQSTATTLDLTTTLFNCLTAEEQEQMLLLIQKLSINLSAIGEFDEHHVHLHEKHHSHDGQQDCHHHPLSHTNNNDHSEKHF